MKVTFLGTGVSIPYEERTQSSIMIQDSNVNILVDAGYGTLLRLEQAGVTPDKLDAILFTHHHIDHNGELLNILKSRWLLECREPLKIAGPKGTKAFFFSLMEAYPYLTGKLNVEICEVEMPLTINNLKVLPVKTLHSIESVGYIIDDTVAISGDTRAFKDFIASECHVMIHELSLPFGFTADYHTTPENLKENLSFLKADELYLTHLYPFTHAVKDRILQYLEIEATIAWDLMETTI